MKETRIEESENLDALRSIFRRRTALEEDESDMFMLKRASPIYESEDEDCMLTPSKRQRTSQSETLHWDEQLVTDEGRFSIAFFPK